jgi:hypothetical protein
MRSFRKTRTIITGIEHTCHQYPNSGAVAVEIHSQAVSLAEASLFGDRLRNPNRQAVSPPRNRSLISHMYPL